MFNRYRVFGAYLFAIPLAMTLGVLAASPDELTLVLVSILLFILALPLFLKWHHLMLILSWNSAFSFFFLPGAPQFWLFFAFFSFGISGLEYIVGRRRFLSVPEMTYPLLALSLVVFVTAMVRGGVGIKAFGGSSHGGKNYVFVFGAVIGYFALTAARIPVAKAKKLTALFLLAGATTCLSNVAYTLGPKFYFIYLLVPTGAAMGQALNDVGLTEIDRLLGLPQTGMALFCLLLVLYGIRGTLDLKKPWRLLLFMGAFILSFFGGFRSSVILIGLVFIFQFFFEGVWRTRLAWVLGGFAGVSLLALAVFADKMPLSVQRAVSFLPVNVDAAARIDAVASTDWRLQMWSLVWRDVPKYLWVGKGYGMDPTDMYLTKEAIRDGLLPSYEESMLAQDYHSGPLSILVPFGIAGTLAFLWVLWAGFRVLYSNYKYGDENLRGVNTILLSLYAGNVVAYFSIFGAFNTELVAFLGIIGFGVSLNGGMARNPQLSHEPRRGLMTRSFAIEVPS